MIMSLSSTYALLSSKNIEVISILKTIILLVIGYIFARGATRYSKKIINRYCSSQQAMIINKVIYFTILTLFSVAAFDQLGFKTSVLIGSAGILTAALAFASQTSISNIISGVFLIMEKSFQVGDKIKIGGTIGWISSIDLLSVKILTPVNTLVRIPNEALIKSEITNLTRFESRRLDLIFKIKFEEDIQRTKGILLEIATKNKFSLKTPLPTVFIKEIDDGEIALQLTVWVHYKEYDDLVDSIYQEVQTAFIQHNILI